MYMETLKMSLLHIGVETLYCPLPVSRPTNGMSEWEGWREGGHYFKLTLSKCIHSPFFFSILSLIHTQATLGAEGTETQLPLTQMCTHIHTHIHTKHWERKGERKAGL